MKKVAIAAAVAGAFATSAIAAEMSMHIQQEMAFEQANTNSGSGSDVTSTNVTQSGNNMINILYSDDLGNGLTLSGNLQLLANPSGGRAAVTSRDPSLSLSGDFGTITMGSLEPWSELGAILGDGWAAAYQIGGDHLEATKNGRSGYGFTNVIAEAIQWQSKDMNGLQVTALYGAESAAATTSVDEEYTDLYVTYSSGPIKLRAAVAGSDDHGGVQGNSMDATTLGLTYDFGVASASIQMSNIEAKKAGVMYESDTQAFNLTVPMSNGRVVFNYAGSGDQKQANATVANSGWDGWDVGYQYDASPNTMLWVRYATQTKDKSYTSTATTNESSADYLQLGIRFIY
jgi:predicted porin